MPDLISASLRLLVEPLTFPFMQRALLATLIVAVACAVVGAFVVSKGLAFMGDALAHASFAGIALALLLRRSIYLGAAAAAVVMSLAITLVSRRGRVSADTASGVLFAGAFSLGIVLISPARNYTVDLFAYVFGNVLGIGNEDVVVIAGTGLVVILTVVLLYRELVFVAFDPVMAETEGIPVGLLQSLLLGLIGLTVMAAVKALGIVLVVAMLVTPAATASMLTHRFHGIMLLGAALAAIASVVGLYVAFYANVASGASTVLVSTLLFLAVLLVPARSRGTEGSAGPELPSVR
jgi:ABC-type Mn2+/Zn2+ transport system permease subunit